MSQEAIQTFSMDVTGGDTDTYYDCYGVRELIHLL